jgi:hypothetical protein
MEVGCDWFEAFIFSVFFNIDGLNALRVPCGPQIRNTLSNRV